MSLEEKAASREVAIVDDQDNEWLNNLSIPSNLCDLEWLN